MSCDGAALVAAAVRAAVLAKAPRRTVGVVATAVTSALVSAKLPREPSAKPDTSDSSHKVECDASPEELLTALRSARSLRRKRKKERVKEAKAAALHKSSNSAPPKDVRVHDGASDSSSPVVPATLSSPVAMQPPLHSADPENMPRDACIFLSENNDGKYSDYVI